MYKYSREIHFVLYDSITNTENDDKDEPEKTLQRMIIIYVIVDLSTCIRWTYILSTT